MRSGSYLLGAIIVIAIVGLSVTSVFRVNVNENTSQKDKKHKQEAFSKPLRIVSANLGADQILLEMVPERMLATSHLTLDPRLSHVVSAANKVSHHVKTDPEQILVIDPDLIVLGRMSPAALFSPLEGSGAKVFRFTEYQSITGIEKSVLRTWNGCGRSG